MTVVMLFVLLVTAPPDDADLEAIIARIERECLRAYPPELLLSMTAEHRTVPEEVDADPGQQSEFLAEDVDLDKGRFYPSTLDHILPALRQHLDSGTRFLDLGSGDGRVVFLANILGARATGIEYDASLVAMSRDIQGRLQDLVDPARLRFLQGDFFVYPWSGYDVIYYYNKGSFEEDRMRAKLLEEMDAETLLILYEQQVPFEGLELVSRYGRASVYRRPAAASPAPEDR